MARIDLTAYLGTCSEIREIGFDLLDHLIELRGIEKSGRAAAKMHLDHFALHIKVARKDCKFAFEVINIARHLLLFRGKHDVTAAKITGVLTKREMKIEAQRARGVERFDLLNIRIVREAVTEL